MDRGWLILSLLSVEAPAVLDCRCSARVAEDDRVCFSRVSLFGRGDGARTGLLLFVVLLFKLTTGEVCCLLVKLCCFLFIFSMRFRKGDICLGVAAAVMEGGMGVTNRPCVGNTT